MATVRVEEGDMRELLNELNHLRRQRDELQTRGTELVMNVRHLTKVVRDLEDQLMRMKGARNELEQQKRSLETKKILDAYFEGDADVKIKEGHYFCDKCQEGIYVCQDRPANWNSNEPNWKGVPACPFCKRADYVHPAEDR